MSIQYNRQYRVLAPEDEDDSAYLQGGGGGGNTGGGGGGGNTPEPTPEPTPENPTPSDPLVPFVNYEIAISSNLQNEIGDFIKLKYEIIEGGDTRDSGDLLLSDFNTDGLQILKSTLTSGVLNLYLENTLPSNYSISKIYYINREIEKKYPTDYTKWNVGGNFIGMQASELLTGGVAVAVILEKTINAPKPTISLDSTNYSKQIKDSDTDGIVNIKFTQTDSDFIDFYIASDKKIRVEAAKGSFLLSFKKDFNGIYGSKKIIAVPYSDLYGTGDKSEILLNFISVNDFPSITEITYVDNIDVPSFSDLEIEYEVKYTTFSTSFIDVDLLLKDKTKISLFKKLAPNGLFKINLKQLKDKFSGWNGSDNVTLTLKPINTFGETELVGNDYEIKTNILYPLIQLDEDVIKKSI
jgi:hypothetical protein